MPESWVSIDAVAEHLGVQKKSVYRWIEHRGLPAVKVGKLWKFKLSEVDTWMQDRNDLRRPGASSLSKHSELQKDGGSSERVVLVVDDDPSIRENLRDFLSYDGCRVLVAGDGAEALAILRAASPRPALIILDLGMPKMDGWRFREEQSRDPELASIPIVVVTADARAEVPGAIVLRKPLRLEQVASAMARLLLENVTSSRSGQP